MTISHGPSTEGEESAALAQVLPTISVYTSGVGQWDQTESYLSQAVGLQEVYGDWSEWGLCMQMIGRSAAHQGEFDRLTEISERFMASAKQREALLEQAWCMSNRVESILYTTNDLAEALELGERSLSLLGNTKNPSSKAVVYSLKALTLVRAGDLGSSLENATHALDLIEGMQPTSFGLLIAYASTSSTLLECWHGEGAPRKGDLTDQVEAAIKALKALVKMFPIAEPRALINQGLYLWHTGGQSKAEKLWAKALDRATELGMQYEIGAAHFEIGRHLSNETLSTALDRREHLNQSMKVFEELGVSYDLQRAEKEMETA